MNGPGKGYLVPARTQRLIVRKYVPHSREAGPTALAQEFQLPRRTVEDIIARSKIQEDGDPVAPKGHRKRKLGERENKTIKAIVQEDNWRSQAYIADKLRPRVSQPTISREFRRMDPPITRKVPVDQDPMELTDPWKESMQEFVEKKLKPVAFKNRDYEDESPIYRNEAPGRGWSERGKPIFRARHYQATKYNLLMVVSYDRVVHWALTTGKTGDPQIVKFMNSAIPKMEEGHTLIWDRLGRGGAKEVPDKCHYNPGIIKKLQDHGNKCLILPPKGKYLNPMELLFCDLKEHYIRPKFHQDGTPMKKNEIEEIIQDYVDNAAPAKLAGFYRERANGRGAKRQKLF